MSREKNNANWPNVVIMGGGTGLSVILNELKHKKVNITAIVGVTDDGGSSGKLRKAAEQVPPGDIRNCISALSELPEDNKAIFQHRFSNEASELDEHSLGNLIISAMSEHFGNYYTAIQKLSDWMQIKGTVLPSAEIPLTLCATFEDGTTVEGETNITSKGKKIEKVTVKPSKNSDEINPGVHVIESIEQADIIVVGPGSLYTSILPNLLIDEVKDAVVNVSAEVMYICNIMTQKGETEGFSDVDHVDVLNAHVGQPFVDTVLVNNGEVPEASYHHPSQDENLGQVRHDFQGMSAKVPRIISDDFLNLVDGKVYHNAIRVANEIEVAAMNGYRQKRKNRII